VFNEPATTEGDTEHVTRAHQDALPVL
jgi:hypothetical protein